MPSTCISEHRTYKAFTVIAFSIIGTETVVLEALEPAAARPYASMHSTITHRDGEALGYVTSRTLPHEIEALPYGEERSAACREYHAVLDGIAAEAILAAYPELHDYVRFHGGHATCGLDAFQKETS